MARGYILNKFQVSCLKVSMNSSSALKTIQRLETTTYYGPREITAFLSVTPVVMGSI